ncbi:MAG TPA: Gfa-like protein, partial [Pelagibacterium sp.]|nr:Gfa-like protein [Pelagibacterium sp.]
MTEVHKLSCHCGDIELEVSYALGRLLECNCSSCARSG